MANQDPAAPYKISPRFALSLRGDSLLFTAEDQVLTYSDPALVQAAIALAASTQPDSATLDPALQELLADGVVTRSPGPLAATAAYWEGLSRSPEGSTVACRCLVPRFERILTGGLAANGLTLDPDAPLLVVAADDYLRPELSDLASRTTPCLLLRPVGHTLWLGPLFVPGRTPCFACLQAALRNHRWQQATVLGTDTYLPQAAVAALSATLALAAAMAATAAAVFLAEGQYPRLEGALLALDTRTMTLTRHLLRSRDRCPTCPPLAATPPDLPSLVSSITGIIPQVRIASTPFAGFFHATATFIAPLPGARTRSLVQPRQSIGKALHPEPAELAAIAEAAERYSLLYRDGDALQPPRAGTPADLAPAGLLLFSPAQYATREHWNRTHGELQWIPAPLAPQQPIRWTLAHSLRTGAPVSVPAGYCFMYYPFDDEPRFCSPDTNGCAAGQTFAGATLHALLEVIERDAVAIWWYNRLHRPALALDAFDDPELHSIRAAFRAEGREPYLLDVSADLAIPVYVAVAPDPQGRSLVFGCAAHPEAPVAARKALAEAAQVWFWSNQGGAPADLQTWLDTESLDRQPWMAPTGSTTPPATAPASAATRLAACCDRLEAAGLEPYVLDLTRRETGVPVARVLVPGMRHFWARFAPGRLYDVPVQLHWLPAPLREEDLNPIPCMI